MKARTKHLENNSTTGLLKASPTFLGRRFFFPLQPFSFLDGACARQHSQGLWRKGFVPLSSHSPACSPHFSQGSFAFPSLPKPSNTQV